MTVGSGFKSVSLYCWMRNEVAITVFLPEFWLAAYAIRVCLLYGVHVHPHLYLHY